MNILDFAAKASYLGSAGLLFLETGALIGLVVPGGDSLVLALGVLARLGHLSYHKLWLLLTLAVILGQWSGYYWGRRGGNVIFRRVDERKLIKAKKLLEKYGNYAILIAPFIPVARTLIPFLAGAGGISWRKYILLSTIAATTWITVTLSIGYYATGWALSLLR